MCYGSVMFSVNVNEIYLSITSLSNRELQIPPSTLEDILFLCKLSMLRKIYIEYEYSGVTDNKDVLIGLNGSI